MSALGQKRTLGKARLMSALPPKADIAEGDWHVRFVPKADILRCSKKRGYSITSVGAREQCSAACHFLCGLTRNDNQRA
jgi:hypothetical protein